MSIPTIGQGNGHWLTPWMPNMLPFLVTNLIPCCIMTLAKRPKSESPVSLLRLNQLSTSPTPTVTATPKITNHIAGQTHISIISRTGPGDVLSNLFQARISWFSESACRMGSTQQRHCVKTIATQSYQCQDARHRLIQQHCLQYLCAQFNRKAVQQHYIRSSWTRASKSATCSKIRALQSTHKSNSATNQSHQQSTKSV